MYWEVLPSTLFFVIMDNVTNALLGHLVVFKRSENGNGAGVLVRQIFVVALFNNEKKKKDLLGENEKTILKRTVWMEASLTLTIASFCARTAAINSLAMYISVSNVIDPCAVCASQTLKLFFFY